MVIPYLALLHRYTLKMVEKTVFRTAAAFQIKPAAKFGMLFWQPNISVIIYQRIYILSNDHLVSQWKYIYKSYLTMFSYLENAKSIVLPGIYLFLHCICSISCDKFVDRLQSQFFKNLMRPLTLKSFNLQFYSIISFF